MLVYGDLERTQSPTELLADLAHRRRDLLERAPGLERHAALVAAFIRLGELAQGLLDAQFSRTGQDSWSPLHRELSRTLQGWAEAVGHSWDSGFAELPALPELALDWPGIDTVTTRQAEGYAFYALYPESYWVAARRSALPPETRVLPGHMGETTLGAERATNPFLQQLA